MSRALIIVDVQNDFCEGGSLAVAGGAAVAKGISLVLDKAGDRCLDVTVSQVQFCGDHAGLRRLNASLAHLNRGQCIVEVLLGDCIALGERGEPCHILLIFVERGMGLGQPAFCGC